MPANNAHRVLAVEHKMNGRGRGGEVGKKERRRRREGGEEEK